MRLQAEGAPDALHACETDRPLALAMPRELQCVAWRAGSPGRTITASIRSSSIVRGAPERGSSRSPSTRCDKAPAPFADVPDPPQFGGDLLVLLPVAQAARSELAGPAPAPSCAAGRAPQARTARSRSGQSPARLADLPCQISRAARERHCHTNQMPSNFKFGTLADHPAAAPPAAARRGSPPRSPARAASSRRTGLT